MALSRSVGTPKPEGQASPGLSFLLRPLLLLGWGSGGGASASHHLLPALSILQSSSNLRASGRPCLLFASLCSVSPVTASPARVNPARHLQLDLTAKVADLCLPRPYPGAQHPPITVGDTELCSLGGSRSFPVSQSTCNSSPQFARPGRPSSTTPPHCPALSPALPASNHSRLRGPPRVGSPLLTLSPSDTSRGRGPQFEPRSRHLGQKGRTEGWEGGKNCMFHPSNASEVCPV